MTDTSREFDGYALDDTLEGRIAQATAIGVLTALPDYLSGKSLIAAYAAGFVGFGALVAYTNAEAKDDAEAAAEVEPQDIQADDQDLGLALPAIVAGVAATSVAVDAWIGRKTAGFLRKKGVTKPWTAMGAVAAAAVFGISELEARDHAKNAK